MPYTPTAVPGFGGLLLYPDPQEVGAQNAVDMLNVDLDRDGRVRSRDGYTNFTAAASGGEPDAVAPFYTTSGVRQLMTSLRDDGSNAYYVPRNTSGVALAASAQSNDIVDADFCRFGGPTAQVVYAASWSSGFRSSANDTVKWDGSTWSTVPGLAAYSSRYPYALEVKAGENRLVGAWAMSGNSRIAFSDAGDPETFGANNYVELTPGDGERIVALVSWRELVFAFKETKFFVFGATTVKPADGTPQFNYRPVASGVGAVGRACAVASPQGVYFLSRRGVYKTTGGDPVLVSRAIDPIFRSGLPSQYLGGGLNQAALDACSLAWHDERLYFSFPSGSATVNDRVLVFDPEKDRWMLWNVPANKLCSFRVGDTEDLMFSYATGANLIGRLSSSYTDDNGVAITSRYQSGFYELGQTGADTYTRYTRLWGSGAPTLSVFTDYGTSDANAGAVTLGTAPAIREGYHDRAYKGRLFSHKLSATSPWLVANLEHDVAWVRP